MIQPDLFEQLKWSAEDVSRCFGLITTPGCRARLHDPRTSLQAAATVNRFAGGHYATILKALRDLGPRTVAEIAAATKLAEQQINKRTVELQRQGKIEPTGQTRPGPSGRQQRVWRVV